MFQIWSLLLAAVSWSGDEAQWTVTSPEAQGMDSAALVEMLRHVREIHLDLHSVMIVRHGHPVLEVEYFPFSKGNLHDVASCTKTVTALVVGLAISDGKIAGVDATLKELFPSRKIASMNDRKSQLRLADLLTMRSGFFAIEPTLSQIQMYGSDDWTQYCLDQVVFRSPGSQFQYFNLNSHLLSAAAQTAMGRCVSDIAGERIFRPIGIAEWGWPADPQGCSLGWGDLRLSTDAMARIGELLLLQGNWNGKRQVSTEWTRLMLTEHVSEVDRNRRFPAYGYQVWLADDGFAFRGRGGQRIIGIPSKDLVFVTTAGLPDEDEPALDRLLDDYVIPSIQSDDALKENGDAAEQLKRLLKESQRMPEASATRELPQIARSVSGKPYAMEKNLYIEQFTLTFENEREATIHLVFPSRHRSKPLDLGIGLDGRPRISPGRYGEPAAAIGRWEGSTFHLDFDELGNINHWQIAMTFDGELVDLVMNEVTDLPGIRATGRLLSQERRLND